MTFASGKLPLPLRLIHSLLDKFSYPLLIVGLVVSMTLLALFVLTGAIYPAGIPPWDTNPLEITGMFLMMALLPAYLLVTLMALVRVNDQTHEKIATLVDKDILQESRRFQPTWHWLLTIVFGIVMVPANTGGSAIFSPTDAQFWVSACIIIGHTVMWTTIGLVFYFSIHESLEFNRLGDEVKIDLYRLDLLNGFGRASLHNLLIIVGGLAISTLQSIDQEIRWINYRNGLIICIPAILILVPLPIWRIHRRIRAEKEKLLTELDGHIRQASRALNENALHKLNALMLRKEQIQNMRNWPMDLSIFSRLVLYVFIPPLAWTGAALVELLIDSVLAG